MDPITIAMGLSQFVPSIIKWVTGSDKAEQAATAVVEVAKAVTGKDSGDLALSNIKADPEAMMKFRLAMADKEADMDKAYLADRQNARQRDTDITKAGQHNWRADILAFLAVAGLVVCVYFIAVNTSMPERAVNAIMFVAGVLASAVRDVYGFEFGSSRGSKEANATISDLLKSK